MKVYYKEWIQTIPVSMEEAWEFFSRPENLEVLTPVDMGFDIISDIKDKEMYEGMLIRYKVSPILGIKLNWCTEITHIRKHEFFIDEQRFGPYAMWHHEHHFEEVAGGIKMTDQLHYAIGFGPLGPLANAIFVGAKIDEIFGFRYQAVEKMFAGKKVGV